VARPNMLGALLPFVLVFVIFYLLIIMPQRKKQKKHMELVENLKPGDRIITTAGIFGTSWAFRRTHRAEGRFQHQHQDHQERRRVIRGATDRLEGE